MTAKEYLNQAYHIDRRIESKLVQAESLRSLAARVNTVFSDMPHSPTPDEHHLEKTISKIIDLENEINADIDCLIDLKKGINEVLGSVQKPEHRTLLEMRYLGFKSWESIAALLSLDLRWVYRLHSRALADVQKIIDSPSNTPLKAIESH